MSPENNPTRANKPSFKTVLAPFWGATKDSCKEGKSMAAFILSALETELQGTGAEIVFDENSCVRMNSEAQALGESFGADIVVWGMVHMLDDETEIEPRLTWIKRNSIPTPHIAALEMSGKDKRRISLHRRKAQEVVTMVYYLAGLHLFAIGDYQKAGLLFCTYIEKTHSQEKNTEQATAYFYLAQCFFMLRQYKALLSTAEEGIVQFPEHGRLRAELGHFLLKLGRRHEGLEHYEAAVKLSPEDSDVRAAYGFCFRMLDRVEDALKEGRAAVALNPQNSYAQRSLGWTIMMTGKPEESLKCMVASVRANPEFDLSWASLGLNYLVLAVKELAKIPKSEQGAKYLQDSIRAFEKSIMLAPVDAYFSIVKNAVSHLASPVDLKTNPATVPGDEDDWLIHLSRYVKGEYPEVALMAVVEREEDAISQSTIRSEAHFYIGMRHLAEGKDAEALKNFAACKNESTFEDWTAKAILKTLSGG